MTLSAGSPRGRGGAARRRRGFGARGGRRDERAGDQQHDDAACGHSVGLLRCLRGELTGSRREAALQPDVRPIRPCDRVVALGPPFAVTERHGDSARRKVAERGAAAARYGFGSRLTARLRIWPPMLSPIWASSPAAWTAVVTSSTPLGGRARSSRAGRGIRACPSRARPRAPPAGAGNCGRCRAAGRTAAPSGAAPAAASAAGVGSKVRGAAALRRAAVARAAAGRLAAGLRAEGLDDFAVGAFAALRGLLRRGLPRRRLRGRRGGGGRGRRSARGGPRRGAVPADPLRAGGRQRGEHALLVLLGLRLLLLGLFDLVSHPSASVRFPLRTRRTPAEL